MWKWHQQRREGGHSLPGQKFGHCSSCTSDLARAPASTARPASICSRSRLRARFFRFLFLQCCFLAASPWQSFLACPNALDAGKPTAASNAPAAPCHSEESQGSLPCWGSTWIDGTSLWCSEQASCAEALTGSASRLAAA